MSAKKKLTAKQAAFIEEYLVDLNATQAAIRAGYKPKRAYSTGQENLSKPVIAEALAAAQQARSERTAINADRVVLELARLAQSDVRRLFTSDGHLLRVIDLDDDTAAAVSSVEVVSRQAGTRENPEIEYVHKIKLWDKNSALQTLAKHVGLNGSDPQQTTIVTIYMPDNRRDERRD